MRQIDLFKLPSVNVCSRFGAFLFKILIFVIYGDISVCEDFLISIPVEVVVLRPVVRQPCLSIEGYNSQRVWFALVIPYCCYWKKNTHSYSYEHENAMRQGVGCVEPFTWMQTGESKKNILHKIASFTYTLLLNLKATFWQQFICFLQMSSERHNPPSPQWDTWTTFATWFIL